MARLRCVGVLVVLGGLGLAACASAPTPMLGFYVDTATPAGVASVAGSLGLPDQAVSGYTDGGSWTSIAGYRPFSGAPNAPGYRLLLSVAMCPTGQSLSGVSRHLGTFRTLARHLISGGQPGAVVRLGEEVNGNYPGGPHSGYAWVTADAGLFRSAYREIVTTMRSVSGAHFLFDFNVNDSFTFPWPNGATGTTGFRVYYPGDRYVDVISDDFYENGFPAYYAGNVIGVIDEAVAHHKSWAMAEWGLSGSDAPGYIRTMASLILGTYHHPHGGTYPAALYESYFDTGKSRLGSTVPKSTAAIAADLTGGH